MKLPRLPARARELPARIHAAWMAGARGCANLPTVVWQWIAARARRAGQLGLSALRFFDRCLIGAVLAMIKAGAAVITFVLAVLYRYAVAGTLTFAGLAMGLAILWTFWFKLNAADWLITDTTHDSAHANLYYVITIICLPLQTFLLLIAGLYGWRTLRQNLEFKQRDVEQQCVDDYLAILKQLRDAAIDPVKIEAAVRAYWIHMIYEFYWWRRGLISRGLFLIWAEFREREFRKNHSYYPAGHAFQANQTPPIRTFVEGFEFCRDQHVFRKNSDFIKFMTYLLIRSRRPERRLWWFEIERFRHRSLGWWF
jgi:hypothetical protein